MNGEPFRQAETHPPHQRGPAVDPDSRCRRDREAVSIGGYAWAGQQVDVARVHRLAAVGAAQVDAADLAARVVAVDTGGPGLPGEPLVAPRAMTISRSTSSAPFSVSTYS